MPRRASGTRKAKKVIRVFCEGQSEQAYTEYLKRTFSDVAVLDYPKETGLFEKAKRLFENNARYRDNADVIDEVWK